VVFVGLFGLCGADCQQTLRKYTNQQPRLLPADSTPTIQQVIDVVNRNNSQIHSFWAESATVGIPHYPSLRASVAYQRTDSVAPGRFRLRAGLGMLGGEEVDLGSNDEVFWFWVRREEPPALYFCRHDQFATSQARLSMPIQPDWLIEAMGIGVLDPGLAYQGPKPLPNDRLQISAIRDTPEGPVTKVMILDGGQGWILEQHLSDAQGRPIASAFTSKHRRDPLTGLTMPTVVQVNCPRAKFSMQLDLGNPEINPPRLAGNPGQLWTMPTYPNTPLVDLASPAGLPQPVPTSHPMPGPQNAMPSSPQSPPPSQAGWRPPVR
jgi:hypothetical protein